MNTSNLNLVCQVPTLIDQYIYNLKNKILYISTLINSRSTNFSTISSFRSLNCEMILTFKKYYLIPLDFCKPISY